MAAMLLSGWTQPALAVYTGPYSFVATLGNKGPQAGVFNEFQTI